MRRATVVGAGLSGLVAAWHLADAGFAVDVCDAADRPGGLIHTLETPAGLVETAANAFVWNDTVAAWFARLELTPAFARKASRRRFIFRNGRPRRWPLTITESIGLGFRIAREGVRGRLGAASSETMAAWGSRVLGPAGVRWMLGPGLQGIYAAPPDMLSARAIFGGRTRGPRVMAAPAGGMGAFVGRLVDRLRARGVRVSLGTRVDALPAGDAVLIATSAAEAARLLAPHAPDAAVALSRIRSGGLVTTTAFFPPHPEDLRGFGVLFPPGSGVTALGVLFNNEIFDGRGAVRSETWIRAAGMAAGDEAALSAQVEGDRRTFTRRDATPIAMHSTRWPAAIPTYDRSVLEVTPACTALPRHIALAGNYLGRIGVAALLETSARAAARLGR